MRSHQGRKIDEPVPGPRPSPATLYRWLERAVSRGLVVRDGDGVGRKPCRYGLKGHEEQAERRAGEAEKDA
jgi:hypothetical protein